MSNLLFLNLNRKLLCLVLSVSLIAIATTTILSSIFADEILREDIKEQLVKQSEDRGYAIQLLFENRIQQIRHLATNPFILASIVELNGITDQQDFNSKLVETEVPLTVEIRNFQLKEGQPVGLEDVQRVGKSGRFFFSLNESEGKGKFS